MDRRIMLLAGVVIGLAAAPAAMSAAGVAGRGEAIYERCAACHSLDRDRTGPKHCGLFGRRAGSEPDFEYSPAMRASGIVWDERTLDRFLTAPMKVVPGTSMGYAGIEDPRERADLIAFLREASRSSRYCAANQ
jgi:cytochrome c